MLQARRTWLIPLLFALALRAFIADGYMPDADGLVRLCTPEGMVTVVIDPATGQPVDSHDDHDDLSGKCPWAFAFFAAALTPLPAAPSLPPTSTLAFPASTPGGHTRATLRLPPARGSPRARRSV